MSMHGAPTFAFMLRHPAHCIALGFGSGLPRQAPGTFGSLAALLAFNLIAPRAGDGVLLAGLAVAFLVGCWACAVTGHALGRPDHGGMVWDEIVAFMLVLVFVPRDLLSQGLAFFAFRMFDIFKPPPIRYFDRLLKSGFGVMFDDLIAAFYTLLVFAVARHLGLW